MLDNVQRKRAVARTRLDSIEKRRAAERTPHREQLPGNESSENRMCKRRGVEVAKGAERAARRVVAAVRPVERDLHEFGERDGAAERDAPAGFGVSAGGSEQACHAQRPSDECIENLAKPSSVRPCIDPFVVGLSNHSTAWSGECRGALPL